MKQLEESWKDVPGYEGIYLVSDLGNVKSQERYVKHSKGGQKLLRERILKLSLVPTGYLQVTLYKDNKQKSFLVHQLVAMAFLGHVPNGLTIVVDHINGIKTDNRLVNLQLLTNGENTYKGRLAKGTLTSKYPGIRYHKASGKWHAFSLKRDGRGKREYIGCFKTEEEAYQALKAKLEFLKEN